MSRADAIVQGLSKRFNEVEIRDLRVQAIYLHEVDVLCLKEDAPRDFTPTDYVILTPSGEEIRGSFWGATVYASKQVPVGSFYIQPEVCALICQSIGEKLTPPDASFVTDLG